MAGKKAACDCCGQLVWEDKLTILDLSGWNTATGNPTNIYKDNSRLTKILCKECLGKKVSFFLRKIDRQNNQTQTAQSKQRSLS